ncbi:hypothetical protein FHW12_002854 [Dokdonella fugitiva]|uniref:Cleaved adhesin domain-containing protein n=1 Tax=Dokdonella fugitiva TaxID=328517 RepID=A0A839F917_9GAMM|nr:choice-of-anchor J domain-containing protein [Dokdonella fugitiva]MBA8888621.1 hypothetical protein [Dokdonella fugitiva]
MKSMHKRNILAAAITCAVAAPAAQAVDLLYQPFNIGVTQPPGCHTEEFGGGAGTYPYPSDWLLFNVDGRTPAGAVAYVNDAWEVREDFGHDVTQCAAFSTSWYSPAGQADDWTWSPAVALTGGATLSWRAIAYDPDYRDGYEVRVKTGAVPTQANQATSDVVFSTPAEETAWTDHSLSLASYAGQTVYIGFRNNSNDKFLLVIDDVHVIDDTPDLVATASPTFTTDYARAPSGYDVTPLLGVTAMNGGGATLTNVSGTATPTLDGSAAGIPVPASAPIASLAIGASEPLTFGAAAAYSGDGAWTTEYALTSDQSGSETNTANNIVDVPGTTIGGNELARWEGAVSGSLGIGAGDGGELGVAFTLEHDLLVGGAHFTMLSLPPDDGGMPPTPTPCPGFDYTLNLRAFDTVNNVPGDVIDTTVPVACTYEGGSYDVAFAAGRHLLAAGTYVLTAIEPVAGQTLPLALHVDRYVPASTWVVWPSSPFGDWAHFEDFGVAFARTPELSLLSAEASIFEDGFDGVPVAMTMQTVHKAAPVAQPSRPTRSVAPTRLTQAKR